MKWPHSDVGSSNISDGHGTGQILTFQIYEADLGNSARGIASKIQGKGGRDPTLGSKKNTRGWNIRDTHFHAHTLIQTTGLLSFSERRVATFLVAASF